MLLHVAPVRAGISEKLIAPIIRAPKIDSALRFQVTANIVPCSPILVILMIEAICSSSSSVLTRATRRKIPENGILHSYRRENLKSYIALNGWTL
jgi:hypothetical protein